jgi:hypothetical protein
MNIAVFLSFLISGSSPKLLVRVYDTPQSVAGLDIAGSRRGKWVDVVVTQEEFSSLNVKNTKILDHNIEESTKDLKGIYHSYPGFVDTLTQIVANYPDIARLDTIGVSWEGREILALKISDNVNIDEDEPELLFDGLHHSREWPALEIPLFFADTLTRGYGNDLNITQAVNSNEIWIVPCMNPDGYVFSHDSGQTMWRKNRRYFPEHGTYGVDPNRNYNGTCNGDPWGAWGAIDHRKASFDPTSNIFCGDAPFSEYETQAIRDLVADHEFTFYVTYHTYGEMIIWSWGYTPQGAPDSTMLSDIGNGMAQRTKGMGGTSIYDAFQGSGLYPTSGTAQEWGYGYGLYVQGMPILAYTVEACTCFYPPDAGLEQVVRENFEGAMYLFEIAGSVRSQMVPWMVPPDIEPVDTVGPDFHLHWEKRAADKYALEELRALSVIEDDAEDSSDLWIFEGFTRSTDYSHSGSYSYISRGSCDSAATMTTAYPLPIADSLVFWCDYTILASDHAFVEVSGTGKEWEFLDGFTGNSQGWERKSYALPPHKSLYTRFRFTVAAISLREDFRVDDIYPVPRFDTVATISENISDTFHLMNRLPGNYWYRVKAHNSRGWGDLGELEDVTAVESGVEETNCQLAIGNCQLSIYPNPFTHNAVVEFVVRGSQPEADEPLAQEFVDGETRQVMSLQIYDLGGRLVRSFDLTNHQSPFSSEGGSASGGNQITWDARDCGSGVYFVVLEAGDFRHSEKITLIRR